MSRWWRAEDTSIDHPKLLRLSDAMHRAWYTLMCVSSANGGELPSVDDVAARLRMKPGQVAAWITHLVTAGLFDNDDGVFRPHNWAKRQYKSDVTDPTNAARQKRYRENKRNAVTTVTAKRPETDNRAETEQNRTDVRDEAQKRVGDFAQAVVRVYAECNSTVLPETSRCTIWISQGYDPEVCLAAIAQILVRKPSISSLSYFDQPIADAHAKKAPPRRALNNDPKPVDWDNVIAFYKRTKIWSRGAGPDPDSPACLAPPEILQKYGIQQTGV